MTPILPSARGPSAVSRFAGAMAAWHNAVFRRSAEGPREASFSECETMYCFDASVYVTDVRWLTAKNQYSA